MKLLGKKRKNGRPKTHQKTFSFRLPPGVHAYIKRQAEDLDITQSAFVLNAIYQYLPPKQLHLNNLSIPDIDGRVQKELFVDSCSASRAHEL